MESFRFPLDVSELQSTLNPVLRVFQSSPVLDTLKPSSTADGFAAFLFLLSALGYITRGRLWDKPDPNYSVWFERPQLAEGASNEKATATRNVAQRLDEGDYQVVIFWGSQSGTAERFAETLGRECHTRFGINALVAVSQPNSSLYLIAAISKCTVLPLLIWDVFEMHDGRLLDLAYG